MKKLLTLTVIVAVVFTSSYAQKLKDSDVPTAVKTAFGKISAGATNAKWSKEESEYEVEYKVSKTEKSSCFDATGKWLNTETKIKTAEVPAAVTASITKEFPGYKITGAEIFEAPDQAKSYELGIEKGESEMEVVVGADGKIMKKEEVKEEEGDEKKEKKEKMEKK